MTEGRSGHGDEGFRSKEREPEIVAKTCIGFSHGLFYMEAILTAGVGYCCSNWLTCFGLWIYPRGDTPGWRSDGHFLADKPFNLGH